MAPLAHVLDYYFILGVTQTASAEEVARAYRKLAFELHPDRNKNLGATEAFQKLGTANDVLKDPEQRVKYDKEYDEIRARLRGTAATRIPTPSTTARGAPSWTGPAPRRAASDTFNPRYPRTWWPGTDPRSRRAAREARAYPSSPGVGARQPPPTTWTRTDAEYAARASARSFTTPNIPSWNSSAHSQTPPQYQRYTCENTPPPGYQNGATPDYSTPPQYPHAAPPQNTMPPQNAAPPQNTTPPQNVSHPQRGIPPIRNLRPQHRSPLSDLSQNPFNGRIRAPTARESRPDQY